MGTREGRQAVGSDGGIVAVVFALVACVLVFAAAALWLSQAAGATTPGSTVVVTTTPADASAPTRENVPLSQPGDGSGEEEPEWVAELPQMLTTHKKDIEAGQYLELIAFVHEVNGQPVRKAAVLFEWQTSRGRYVVHETTDFRGVASMRRWIGQGERGAAHKVRVSVDTETWSSERYAWFIPK